MEKKLQRKALNLEKERVINPIVHGEKKINNGGQKRH